ncbi:hypothetical protein OP10G_2896 [Fimbriimonas ginsengisoli Gsoil 348]|uniref:VOC domain-containing protein n=1 Tax=Fimbriimonas ginsengisoli Gsoil 348 TaxID=661478 RepID=A0A068NXA4_FIMGI|nr:hypothetical protein OP10G_2896 [Fimbriimonas ginsengisoli Gsoil 348]
MSDLRRSLAFYAELGFQQGRVDGGFAVLTWEGCELFLDERPAELLPRGTQANVRVMVADVDEIWDRVSRLGLDVMAPIGDRYYGLRDFTVLDPDGFGIRFASPIGGAE